MPDLDDRLLQRYSRHILLNEIGIEGQARIGRSRMLVIGAGGLGSPAAYYLASAGVGRITLVDGDSVDLTNLQRQILHTTERIGQPKAESGRLALAAINPEVEVVARVQRADAAQLRALVAEHDVVLDCSDNFATRHAVNRACVEQRRPLVSGAAIRFDGQLAVFDLRQPEAPAGGRGAEARRRRGGGHRGVDERPAADDRGAGHDAAHGERAARSALRGVRGSRGRGLRMAARAAAAPSRPGRASGRRAPRPAPF